MITREPSSLTVVLRASRGFPEVLDQEYLGLGLLVALQIRVTTSLSSPVYGVGAITIDGSVTPRFW